MVVLGRGRVTARLKPEEHRIRTTYSAGSKYDYHSSSSANQICTVGPEGDLKPHTADHPVPVG